MRVSQLRRALRTGDLAAVALAQGPGWLPVLRHAREVGAAILPIDVRLSGKERAALIDTAQPSVIADEDGVRRADGVPIDPAIALVVATSGTSGHARLAELPGMAVEAASRQNVSARRIVGPLIDYAVPLKDQR